MQVMSQEYLILRLFLETPFAFLKDIRIFSFLTRIGIVLQVDVQDLDSVLSTRVWIPDYLTEFLLI